tara:strand:+ start:1691 stop:2287 length:597 start_codon:yes stop_codon:yes gene_type:complete
MMFRHLVSTLIVVLLAISPVLGQGNNGNDQGGGKGSDQGNGSGDAGGQHSAANGSGNGAAGGGENDQKGNHGSNEEKGRAGQGGSNSQDRENSGASNSASSGGAINGISLPPGISNRQNGIIVTLSPDETLEAVRSRQAATLAEIAKSVKRRAGGDIIDANLLQVGRMLIYAVKVLDQSGQLSIQYYYARSGRYIGSE